MQQIDKQHVEKLASIAIQLQSLLDAIREPEAEVPPEIQEAVDYYVANRICLRCEKRKEGRYTRGLDANCYNMTIKEINAGEVMESDLVRMGRITAVPRSGGRKATTPKHSQLTPLRPLPPERQPSQDDDDALAEFTEEGMEATIGYAKGRRSVERKERRKKKQ